MLLSLGLWQKVKQYVEKKEREAFLKMYGFDNECPHCNKWQGNCNGIIGALPEYPNRDSDAYRCGNCKRWFIMDTRSMISMVAKDQGPAFRLDVLEQSKE